MRMLNRIAPFCCMLCLASLVGCGGTDDQTTQGRFAQKLVNQLRTQFDDQPVGNDERTYRVTGVAGIEEDGEPRLYMIRIDFARDGHDDHSYQWRILARHTGEWRLEDVTVAMVNHKSGNTRVAAIIGTAQNAEMAQRVEAAFNDAREQRTF